MFKDFTEITLYHGSFTKVDKPDLKHSKKGKDFGRGFYLTTDKAQGIRFAKLIARRNGLKAGVINTYKFTNFEGLDIFEFTTTDEDWLNCIIGNRNSKYKKLATPWSGYSVLAGKIADDDTARTINAYMAGAFGDVNSKDAIKKAIEMFKPEKLKDQICFKTKESLKCLEFIESEVIDND